MVHLICLIYLVETVAKFVTSYLLHLVKDINRKFSLRIGPKRAIFCFFRLNPLVIVRIKLFFPYLRMALRSFYIHKDNLRKSNKFGRRGSKSIRHYAYVAGSNFISIS